LPVETKRASALKGMLAHPGLLLVGAAAFSMSTLFSALKPVLLARLLEETSWSEGFVGLVVAMPFIGIAVASLLYYFRPPRAALRHLAMAYGLLLVLAELLSAKVFHHASWLLPLQFVAGFAVGALMAGTSRLVAVSACPDESFGFIDMLAVTMMSVMVAAVGAAVAASGVRGGYLLAAGLCAAYALLIALFKEPKSLLVHHDHAMPLPQVGLRPIAVISMGVLFVTCSGVGFAFMFTLAADLGLGYDVAGERIGLLLLFSALACQVGGWASGRFGPRYPLLGAFTACAGGWWLAVHANSLGMFFLGLIPAVCALQFTFPILLALAGSLDEHGHWAGIGAPLVTSGFAWAAVLAGVVVQNFSVEALGTTSALGMFLCVLLLWPATAAPAVGPIANAPV